MTLFIIAAIALTLATLAYLLQPLWRGQRALALTLGAVLLAATAGLYLWVGTPPALDAANRKAPETIEEAITQLQAALRRDPTQPEGWQLLGRQYSRMGQRDAALEAYGRAIALDERNPDLLAEAAEVRALLDPERRFDEQAGELLQRALQIDPNHERARLFTGVMQRQAGHAAAAAATWEPLLVGLDPAPAAALRERINEARADAGLEPLADAPAAEAGAHAIQVQLSLAPALAGDTRFGPDTTVFVLARIPDGPPMPVAVQKRRLGELPLQLTLGDADAAMPTLKLSAMSEVEVLARISPSGDATPQPGDVQSVPVRIRLPATGTVELVIAGTP